jgi:hypothetical protein
MKTRIVFLSLSLSFIFIFSLGAVQPAPQAAAIPPETASLAPASVPNLPLGDRIWNVRYIDGLNASLNIGAEPSLAFDPLAQLPYISYYNNTVQKLVLGRPVITPYPTESCAFGAWWCPVVDTAVNAGLGSSLAIHDQVSTPGGKLGISYYDAANKRLKFMQWACSPGCGWTTYLFPSGTATSDSGRYSSLKYNSLGEPQIAYTSTSGPGSPTSAMMFCTWVGSSGNTAGAFNCEAVENRNIENCCTNPSLALDPISDAPSIAYYDGQFGNLRYVQRVGNGVGDCTDKDWYCYWLDFTGDVGKYPSLDIIQKKDGSVRTGIAYYDATNGTLKYARPVAGTGNCSEPIGGKYYWQCDTIDTIGTGIPGSPLSLVLDKDANPYIAYQDFSGVRKTLKIARVAGTVGLMEGNCGPVTPILHLYRCDTLDPGGTGSSANSDAGYFPSIKRSPTGLLYIAYKEYITTSTSGSLKLAYQSFGTYVPLNRK